MALTSCSTSELGARHSRLLLSLVSWEAFIFLNRIDDDTLVDRCRRRLFGDALAFLVFFLAFVIRTLVSDGFAVNPATQEIYMEPLKYLNNLLAMPAVLAVFLVGVVLVLVGIARGVFSATPRCGIWFAGIGTVFTVTALLLLCRLEQHGLLPVACRLAKFTHYCQQFFQSFHARSDVLRLHPHPFVLAYIIYAWRALERKQITREELKKDDHAY